MAIQPRRTLTRQLSGGSTGKALRSRMVDCNSELAVSPSARTAGKRELQVPAARGPKKAKTSHDHSKQTLASKLSPGSGEKLGAYWPPGTDSPQAKGGPKRPQKGKGGPATKQGGPEEGGWKDLLGQIVDIPAHVFNVDIPDMYYRGVVKKRDSAHKDSLVIRFVEDGSTYWLPAVEVRHWLQEMHLHGRTFASRTVGAASDDFAARVLTDLRSSSIQNSGTVSSAKKGPADIEINSVPRRRRSSK